MLMGVLSIYSMYASDIGPMLLGLTDVCCMEQNLRHSVSSPSFHHLAICAQALHGNVHLVIAMERLSTDGQMMERRIGDSMPGLA